MEKLNRIEDFVLLDFDDEINNNNSENKTGDKKTDENNVDIFKRKYIKKIIDKDKDENKDKDKDKNIKEKRVYRKRTINYNINDDENFAMNEFLRINNDILNNDIPKLEFKPEPKPKPKISYHAVLNIIEMILKQEEIYRKNIYNEAFNELEELFVMKNIEQTLMFELQENMEKCIQQNHLDKFNIKTFGQNEKGKCEFCSLIFSSDKNNKGICDDKFIFCANCAKDIIINGIKYNISKKSYTLPYIRCPFAEMHSVKHQHCYSLVGLCIALSVINPTDNDILNLMTKSLEIFKNYQIHKIGKEETEKIEEEGSLSIRRIVCDIQNKILCDACPNCNSKFEFIGGCQSMYCHDNRGNGCKHHFCNICLEHHSTSDVHEHVKNCIVAHKLEGVSNYFLSSKSGYDWRQRQRSKRIKNFLNQQVKKIDILGIINVLAKDKDINPYLAREFPEYGKIINVL
jgi:hypothetical protein